MSIKDNQKNKNTKVQPKLKIQHYLLLALFCVLAIASLAIGLSMKSSDSGFQLFRSQNQETNTYLIRYYASKEEPNVPQDMICYSLFQDGRYADQFACITAASFPGYKLNYSGVVNGSPEIPWVETDGFYYDRQLNVVCTLNSGFYCRIYD
jgi:hypothetical protein